MDKNELFCLIESLGYDIRDLKKGDIRKDFVGFVGSLLDEIKQFRDERDSQKIVKTPLEKDSKKIVKPQLIGVEKQIYELLENPTRFIDIVDRLGQSKQYVTVYLKSLINKGLITKTRHSKKNVVYSRD